MTIFDYIIGVKILNVQRIDLESKNEMQTLFALIFTFENIESKLIISSTNDGFCLDIQMVLEEQISNDFGLEFSEHILNNTNIQDDISSIIGSRIIFINFEEADLDEKFGSNFILRKGKYIGFELKTLSNKITFSNKNGLQYRMQKEL